MIIIMGNKNFRESKFWIWWKRYGEHLTAPLILIALILLGYQLYVDNQLKNDISNNCGWEEDDYKCYCVKDTYHEMKDRYEGTVDLSNLTDIGVDDDPLDG